MFPPSGKEQLFALQNILKESSLCSHGIRLSHGNTDSPGYINWHIYIVGKKDSSSVLCKMPNEGRKSTI